MSAGETWLVTGGLGFLGSNFLRLLHAERPGLRLVNLDKETYAASRANLAGLSEGERYRLVVGDVADPETVNRLFREEEPAVAVNFAAESHVDRSVLDASPFVTSNVRGVQVLLDAARRHGLGRFVQVSTDEVYGDVAGTEGRTGEEAPLRPSSPYAATKASADHLCRAYRRTYGSPVLLARPSNNYGPRQYPEKLVPLTIRRLLAGEEVPLYGDGRQRRDWLFVADAIRGVRRVAEEGEPGRAYNLATGTSRANRAVVGALCELVAEETEASEGALRDLIAHVEDRPGHDRRYAPSAERARAELGWRPRTGFREGLRRTVAWYRRHPEWVEQALGEEFEEYRAAVYGRSWEGAG